MPSSRAVIRSALLLPLLLAACEAGGGGGSSGFAVRDSAGIRIAENTSPAWKEGKGWTLGAEPSVEIGVVDGAPEYQFNWIVDARRLSNGEFAVVNGGSQEIRYYDASGKYLRSVGGKGGGPGEFQGLYWIQLLRGDSLVAYDLAQKRFSTFDSQGRLVGSKTFAFRGGRGTPRGVGRFDDGTILVGAFQSPASAMVNGARRDSVLFVRYSPSDSLMNVTAGLAGEETYSRVEGRGVTYGSPFFGRSSNYVFGRNRLFAGDNDVYQIGIYSALGKIEALIRRSGELREVTKADIDLERQRRVDRAAGFFPQTRNMYVAMVAEEPIRPTMPAYASLLLDADGDLWVQEYPAPAAVGTEWTVFDPEGRMLGKVSMPERFKPVQIGGEFVLGVWKDDLDVERVRMYRLEKLNTGES